MTRLLLICGLLGALWGGALPVAAQDSAQYSAQPITPANVDRLAPVAMLGRGWINQIAWSPDGTLLAVGSSAGVWLHDTTDWDAPPRFLATRADTWSVVFSADGRLLATGGRDLSVRVWEVDAIIRDPAHAAPLHDLICQAGEWWKPVESLAFNPAGTVLACASDGVQLWDMATGGLLAGFTSEPDFWGDAYVTFSPDGSTLATTGRSGQTQAASKRAALVRQWDAHTYELLSSWKLAEPFPTGQAIAYSPDGSMLAAAGKHVEIRDTATGTLTTTLENTSGVRLLAFSPDGGVLLTVGYGFGWWNPATGQRLIGPSGDYRALSAAFSPDGTRVAAASAAGQITIWERPSGAPLATLDGYNLGGTERGGASSDTISKTCFAFSPDGTTLAAGTGGYITSGGRVELWDIEQQTIRATLDGYGSMGALAYSPDGTRLATASALSGLRVWDTATNTVHAELMEYGEAVSDLAFSPDGSRLAAGLTYGTIRLWWAESGEPLGDFEVPADYMSSIALSADGALLAAGFYDGSLRWWLVARGESLGMLETDLGPVHDLAFSPILHPDGLVLAAVGGLDDGVARLWVLGHNGGARELAAPARMPSIPTDVAFSPDGTLLVIGHRDGGVRLWDAATGDLLTTLEGYPPAYQMRIAFSPDGALLATGGWDGTIWLWAVP